MSARLYDEDLLTRARSHQRVYETFQRPPFNQSPRARVMEIESHAESNRNEPRERVRYR